MDARTVTATAFALLLAACGGGGDGTDATASERSAAATTPLFDDNGRPLATQASRSLVATKAQLEWQELVASPSTVVLDLDALGSGDAALVLAQHVRSWRGVQGLAYFVRGGRDAEAVRVADALIADGVEPVFLVR